MCNSWERKRGDGRRKKFRARRKKIRVTSRSISIMELISCDSFCRVCLAATRRETKNIMNSNATKNRPRRCIKYGTVVVCFLLHSIFVMNFFLRLLFCITIATRLVFSEAFQSCARSIAYERGKLSESQTSPFT